MKDYEKIARLAGENHNIVQTNMIVEAGIRKEKIGEMLKMGMIERIGRGLYALSMEEVDEYYEFQQACPRGIFSYGTAAYFWELSDRVPNILNCSLPRGYHASARLTEKVICHYVSKDLYPIGITEIRSPQGAPIAIYDRERTICDLVKNRKKIDMQLYSMALNLYFRGREKDIRRLMKYGKMFHIVEELEKYMEVLF